MVTAASPGGRTGGVELKLRTGSIQATVVVIDVVSLDQLLDDPVTSTWSNPVVMIMS